MKNFRIHICGDIHNEFGQYSIPKMDDEKNIVVVLTGDILVVSKKSTYGSFLIDVNERFKSIIYICGNHEHYSGKFPLTVNKLKEYIKEQKLDNVYVLEKETIIINNIAFIGATLWTDMDKNNPLTMWNAGQTMNDYKQIRTGTKEKPWMKKLKPLDTMSDHQRAKEYIFSEIRLHKKEGRKVVVVTHHLPSFESVPEYYRSDKLNGAYASELSYDILDAKPDIWAHGHSHNSMDYYIGNTRVLNNPRGYAPDELNEKFDDTLIIEI